MTKLGDLQTKKTLHELTKEFPNKTYRELEKYRDADRNEEAQQIITQQENEELKEDQQIKSWEEKHKTDAYYWQDQYEDAKEKIKELQSNLDRIKKENNDLYNRIAKLSDPVQKARESGL